MSVASSHRTANHILFWSIYINWYCLARRWLGSVERYDLYSLLNTTRVIKSRRMRQPGDVACMRNRRGAYGFWCGNLREKYHLEDLGVDRTILNWIFNRAVGSHWLKSIWFTIGACGGLLWKRWWTFHFPYNAKNFLSSTGRVNSQEGLCYTELVS